METPITYTLADERISAANGALTVTATSIKGKRVAWQYDGVNDSGGNAATLPAQDEQNPQPCTEADVLSAIVASDDGLTEN